MHVSTGRLQILTAAAILVLISGGIAAYAQNQSFSAAIAPVAQPNASTTTTTPSSPVQYDSAPTTSTFTTTITSTTTLTTTKTVTTSQTSSTTSTTTSTTPLCTPPTQPGQVGRLVLPITPTGQAQQGAISFSNGKGCVASITAIGGIFSVELVLRYAKPVTQYEAVLVANGTNYPLGNLVTGPDGSGQMQNQVLLTPGKYVVSVQIFDVSSTPGQSTLVLQTGQGTIVSPPFPTPNTSNQNNQSDHGDTGSTGDSGQRK